jgi:hypothetical protein
LPLSRSGIQLRFFTDEKHQRGTAHSEYAQYWRDNSDLMPRIALRLSAGMLPLEFFTAISDPVFLHDARIQTATTGDSDLILNLHGDDRGGLRKIDIQYDCTGLAVPVIPPELQTDNSDCDLMCHEFDFQSDWFSHRILFASGTEIAVQFRSLTVKLTPDHA